MLAVATVAVSISEAGNRGDSSTYLPKLRRSLDFQAFKKRKSTNYDDIELNPHSR